MSAIDAIDTLYAHLQTVLDSRLRLLAVQTRQTPSSETKSELLAATLTPEIDATLQKIADADREYLETAVAIKQLEESDPDAIDSDTRVNSSNITEKVAVVLKESSDTLGESNYVEKVMHIRKSLEKLPYGALRIKLGTSINSGADKNIEYYIKLLKAKLYVMVHPTFPLPMNMDPSEESDSNDDDDLDIGQGGKISLICPLSKKLLVTPVKNDMCIHVYEKDEIERFIRRPEGDRCPECRVKIGKLTTDEIMYERLAAWDKQNKWGWKDVEGVDTI